MEAAGMKTTTLIKCVGGEGDDLWIETSLLNKYMHITHLLLVQPDRTVTRAYFCDRKGKRWYKCDINKMPEEPPKEGEDAPKPDIKESNEEKTVAAGTFLCRRIDVKMEDMSSTTWFSKKVYQLSGGESKHGGLVAMESSSAKMWLGGMGDEAKPRFPIPGK
jgi:hypothetical protein